MRILHLHTETGYRGGERQVALLVRGLADRGHRQVLVGRTESPLLDSLEGEGADLLRIDKPGLLGYRSPLVAIRVRGLARDFKPDIVHAHTGHAHTLALAAFRGRVPIVTTRRVDFPVGGNLLSARKYTAPGQHFIAISTAIRDVLVRGGVPPDRIDIVHSGVDTARVRGGDGTARRREWLAGDAGPVIGFVGALVDHKAPWILGEAAPLIRSELPGARVVFVGEGGERPRLEALRAANPESIVLAGWREDIADCLAAFDLFVMPSKLEGLCTALIDALAAGIPSVASRVGGIPDVIEDGVTGVLVPPLDPGALARAVVDLWRDEARRRRLIVAGERRVKERFTAEAMIRGTEAVYRRLAPGA